MSGANVVIELNSPQEVYYPGQVVSGTVTADLREAQADKDLIVKLVGKTKVKFKGRTGKHGRGEDAHTKMFSSHRYVLEHQKILSGLKHGKNVLDFEFDLPHHSIPSSIEASFGSIRYYVSAHIGYLEVSETIIVNDVVDTNLEQYAERPSGDAYESVNCLCLIHGSLTVDSHLDRGAYCPGEVILVSANIANDSRRTSKRISAKLLQTTIYAAEGRKKTTVKTIATVTGPKVKKGDTFVWTEQPLQIPAIAPTVLNDPDLTVTYEVHFEVGFTCQGELGIRLPVVIGTVPHLQSAVKTDVVDDSGPTVSIFGYPDNVKVTYAAKQGISDDDMLFKSKECKGAHIRHPVYTFITSNEISEDGGEVNDGNTVEIEEVVEEVSVEAPVESDVIVEETPVAEVKND